jgi:hypothetical protein
VNFAVSDSMIPPETAASSAADNVEEAGDPASEAAALCGGGRSKRNACELLFCSAACSEGGSALNAPGKFAVEPGDTNAGEEDGVGAPATAAEAGGGLPPPASPCSAEGNTCCRDEEDANGTPGCNGSGDGDCPVIVAYGLGVGASLLKLTSKAPVSDSILALLVARANNAGEGVDAPPAAPLLPPAPVEGSDDEEGDRSVLMACDASLCAQRPRRATAVSGDDTKGTVVPNRQGMRASALRSRSHFNLFSLSSHASVSPAFPAFLCGPNGRLCICAANASRPPRPQPRPRQAAHSILCKLTPRHIVPSQRNSQLPPVCAVCIAVAASRRRAGLAALLPFGLRISGPLSSA